MLGGCLDVVGSVAEGQLNKRVENFGELTDIIPSLPSFFSHHRLDIIHVIPCPLYPYVTILFYFVAFFDLHLCFPSPLALI
jgi:hypothetical protein